MAYVLVFTLLLTWLFYYIVIEPLFINPLSRIPGPKLYALTQWRLALDDWNGNRTVMIDRLHQRYGPVVRIGPKEVHFNSLTALRTIYGAGSGYERTIFYRMFDVYGKQNLFTFHSSKQHADRKKLLANAYSKSSMMKSTNSRLVEEKVEQYLDFVDAKGGKPDEIFTSLHYFSLDSISHFVYGFTTGGTQALTGNAAHQNLLIDILDPSRRRLSWFLVHLTTLTKWMYTRVGRLENLLRPCLPMQKPATYTGVRKHALEAWHTFKTTTTSDSKLDTTPSNLTPPTPTIMSLLYNHHHTQQSGSLDDLDIASECADHLLAGIDTTADTLMFLIWALSLPQNSVYQHHLTQELRPLPSSTFNASGVPTVESASKLIYLNAVIKETLRCYAPLPASEPRILHTDAVIDNYAIAAGTIVDMAPYSLHRNPDVFTDPHRFDPGRWLVDDSEAEQRRLLEMNKWFWAFSSGARMCIGMHLAMAEMTTLVAAVYRKYETGIAEGFEGVSPAITSRFELFYDLAMSRMKEHECWINFIPHDK